MEEKIVYFETGGKHNTKATLELAKERAMKRNIKNVIVASHTGFTAEIALEIFKDLDVLLTIVVGRRGGTSYYPPFSASVLEKLESLGHRVCFANEVEYNYPDFAQIVFRRLGEGVKVCVQDMLIVAEIGIVPEGEEVVAVAGTGSIEYEKGDGADTAVVIEVMKSRDFFIQTPLHLKEERRKIKEIICKPR